MPYTRPTFPAIRAAYLRDVQNLDPAAAVDGDSDHFVRASATASAVDGVYRHQEWVARQLLPDTADPENIEHHAALRGLYLKGATRATGTVRLFPAGQGAAAPCAAGLVAVLEDGREVASSAAFPGGIIPEEGLELPAAAVTIGAVPDYAEASAVLQAPPSGIAGETRVTMKGGTDAETHVELLARLLSYMRNPPGGGTKYDYERWALEVPGVTTARCLPCRRGPGTVDVLVTSQGGLPTAELVAAVQAHLDDMRPVTCSDCLALPPDAVLVDILAAVRVAPGYTLPQLHPKVYAALATYFQTLAPGDPVVAAGLAARILDVPGVTDVRLLEPAGNLSAESLRWYRLGTLTLEAF